MTYCGGVAAPRVSDVVWHQVRERINAGATVEEACRMSGVSTSAYRREGRAIIDSLTHADEVRANTPIRAGRDPAEPPPPDPIDPDDLVPWAKLALDDFAVFRRRYLGRVATPWQVEVAERLLEHLHSDDREQILLNVPPGAGKSTLFHDIAVWMIVRDRTIRILIVSATGRLANGYARRIRDTLARRQPYRAPRKTKELGLALDAEASIVEDFGRFQPLKAGLWRGEEFVVEQPDGISTDNKEPTVAAYGLDEEYVGHRANLVLCDDVATPDNARDGIKRDRMIERWDSVVEERAEPGGLLAVIGQRLGPTDLSAYVKAKQHADGTPLYEHWVYRAHDEDRCTGQHDNLEPWPASCLLDPGRLPWERLDSLQQTKPDRFAIVYQQSDVAPGTRLVEAVWAYGGMDDNGVIWPGCLDLDRKCGQVPEHLAGRVMSVATVDPSGSALWAVEWWLHQADLDLDWLIDAESKRMQAEHLIGYDTVTRQCTGIMPAWQKRSVEMGRPITHWIVEVNAAQRYLLAHQFVRDWARQSRVMILPHTTGPKNKMDTEMGVEGLLPDRWRSGMIRLPYSRLDSKRWLVNELIEQHVWWTRGKRLRTDLVMAAWFYQLCKPQFAPLKAPPRQWRPSWMLGQFNQIESRNRIGV